MINKNTLIFNETFNVKIIGIPFCIKVVEDWHGPLRNSMTEGLGPSESYDSGSESGS